MLCFGFTYSKPWTVIILLFLNGNGTSSLMLCGQAANIKETSQHR